MGLAIFVAALAARLIYLFHLMRNSPAANILIHDSALFNHFAHQILAGKLVLERAFYLAPLYSYFLALVYFLFGESFSAVRLVQFLLGSLGAVLVFALGRRFLTRRAAAMAGFFAALYAPFLFFDGCLLGTSLNTFLFLLATFLLVSAVDGGSWARVFLSGLSLGLAVTGRPNLLTAVPAFLGAPWLFRFGHRRRISVLAAWTTAFALPIAGTTLHNFLAEGQWIPLTTHGGINFYIGNHRGASGVWEAPAGMEPSVSAINLEDATRVAEAELGRSLTAAQVSWYWYRKTFAFILSRPYEWLWLLLKKTVLFLNPYEIPLNFQYAFHQQFSWLLRIPFTNLVFLMPFALFGLVVAWPERNRLGFLYGLVTLYSLGVILFFVSDRYRVVVVPYLILFAAYGAEWLIACRRSRPVTGRWVGLSLAVAIALSFWLGARQSQRANPAGEYYNLCVAHLNEGHLDEAIYWGRKAILSNPSLENAHYNLGIALMKKGRYREALEAFATVVRLDPKEVPAWGNIGGIHLMLGDTERAIGSLRKAVELDSHYVPAWLNLGIAHYRQGDLAAARRAWEQALRVDPENPTAKSNLEVLEALEK
ncbi:MAG: tetratricopeptide repeat protein [candidate division KSB1 bacterium]|nr:tetratricopeptide repeat protein [candidate division KSB1 bacterium]